MAASGAPAGEVTLMFTDIEGSTRGWDTYRERFHEALQRHNALIREALAAWKGYEVKTIGDSFMVAFSDPCDAALCALEVQRRIEDGPFAAVGGMRVRVGLHTGFLEPVGGDYFGPPVNRAARIERAAHGGMILLSADTAQRIEKRLAPEARLLDLGLHRLRDLGAAQRLYQLTHSDLPARDYPPLRTLEALPHNFPAQVTSFIGRDREIAELTELIAGSRARLVTLTGPGGSGKTRLSMQFAAERLQDFPDGVWIVELGQVMDANEVPTALALALSDSLSTEGDADARAQVFDFLAPRKSLLVLDNFEQVIDAARFVSDLLRACPHLACLVTSRQLLRISGEHEFPVAPLALPPPDVTVETCLNFESVRLFVERCQAARPDFALTPETTPVVADICHRLEGLPLAVELTATLVRGMTPPQILTRLNDRFRLLATARRDLEPRQRSLRGAIDWSYELLTEEERALFAELSVFAGGFFLEDVEAVCSAPDALMLVFDLRDKSLLRVGEQLEQTRYSLLDTLREYALEKLESRGELDALRNKHALYFLEQAEQWADQLTEGDAIDAMRRMTVDIDNMRAGMAWAEARQEQSVIAGYSAALACYFLRRGPYVEAERWLQTAEQGEQKLAEREDAQVALREGSHTRKLARILLRRGLVHYKQAQYDPATDCFLRSLELFTQVQDWRRIVSALTNLGTIAWATSHYREAQTRWEEALEIVRQHHLTRDEGDLLTNLAFLCANRGESEQARRYFEQALDLLRRTGDMEGLAYAHFNCGELLLNQYSDLSEEEHARQGAELLSRVQQHIEESHHLFQTMSHSEGGAQSTERLGLLALLQGDALRAEELCRQALRMSEENDDRRCQLSAHRDLGRIALHDALAQTEENARTTAFQQVAAHLEAALRFAEELEDALEVAGTLRYAGQAAEARGDLAAALRAYLVAEREYVRLELPCPPAVQAARQRVTVPLPETARQQIAAEAEHATARHAAEQAFAAFGQD